VLYNIPLQPRRMLVVGTVPAAPVRRFTKQALLVVTITDAPPFPIPAKCSFALVPTHRTSQLKPANQNNGL
jgi:hypothetical protein